MSERQSVRVSVMKSFLYAVIIWLLIAPVVYADTILVGSDGSNYDTACWVQAETLESCRWKASRYLAKNTGTISYFQMRVASTPTGCTDDDGCWAIYEGGTSTSLGALKAWTCFSGYNWTTTGAGLHNFAVENTETDLTVTKDQYYWLVFHSYAVDSTYYASAGCSAYIPAYRGNNSPEECMTTAGLDISTGWAGRVEIQCSYASPPAPSTFDSTVQTYVMWGVWASAVCDADHLNLCTSLSACEGAGGYWYDDTCNAAAPDDPEITDTDVSFVHGSNVEISGYSFGTKSPAAPLIWDDGEGATIDTPSAVTGSGTGAERADGGTGWDYCAPLSATNSTHNMQYRTSWNSMPHPHARSTKYLAASHYDDCGGSGPCNEVSVGYNSGPASNTMYIHYFLRLDPEWEDVSVNGQNYKEIRIGSINCTGGDECSRYLAHAVDAYNVFYGTELILQNPNSYFCQLASEAEQRARSIGDLRVPNPALNWVRREIRVQEYPGMFAMRTNNIDASTYYGANVWDTPIVCESTEHLWTRPDGQLPFGMVSIGTYARAVLSGGLTDARMKRYFDDIYIDNTWSRVMLCNDDDYDEATICEPQIPSEWSTSSITVKANLGALTGETAYLFVFDSDNNANSTGYEVTLGDEETPVPTSMKGVKISGAKLQ